MQEERTSSRGRRYTKAVLDGLLSDEDEDGVARRPFKVTPAGQPASKRGRPSQKCRMVDITALLGMPQRQAAEVLGISESMLCKRYSDVVVVRGFLALTWQQSSPITGLNPFVRSCRCEEIGGLLETSEHAQRSVVVGKLLVLDECTKRKWPFRYLGKLDKKIAAKKALLARSGNLNAADRVVLDALLREKELILTPIQIRVTESQDGQNNTKPKKAARASEDDEDELVEDDEEEEGGTERREEGGEQEEEEQEEQEEEEEEEQRPPVAPPTMQKVRRRAVFEDDGAMNDLGSAFNPASILLALSGGV